MTDTDLSGLMQYVSTKRMGERKASKVEKYTRSFAKQNMFCTGLKEMTILWLKTASASFAIHTRIAIEQEFQPELTIGNLMSDTKLLGPFSLTLARTIMLMIC